MKNCGTCRHSRSLMTANVASPTTVICKGGPPSRYAENGSSGFPLVPMNWDCAKWASRSWIVRLAMKLLP